MIYKMEQDLEKYKYYLIKGYNDSFLECSKTGVVLGNPSVELELFDGKNRKEMSRSDDFNISTFSIFGIFLSEELKNILELKLQNIYFIKAKTNNDKNFYFLNSKTIIDSLIFNDKDALENMILSGCYRFNKEIINKQKYIFRDKNIPYEIFFTKDFVIEYEPLLKGINFKKIG